jgi:hypothetical protein
MSGNASDNSTESGAGGTGGKQLKSEEDRRRNREAATRLRKRKVLEQKKTAELLKSARALLVELRETHDVEHIHQKIRAWEAKNNPDQEPSIPDDSKKRKAGRRSGTGGDLRSPSELSMMGAPRYDVSHAGLHHSRYQAPPMAAAISAPQAVYPSAGPSSYSMASAQGHALATQQQPAHYAHMSLPSHRLQPSTGGLVYTHAQPMPAPTGVVPPLSPHTMMYPSADHSSWDRYPPALSSSVATAAAVGVAPLHAPSHVPPPQAHAAHFHPPGGAAAVPPLGGAGAGTIPAKVAGKSAGGPVSHLAADTSDEAGPPPSAPMDQHVGDDIPQPIDREEDIALRSTPPPEDPI